MSKRVVFDFYPRTFVFNTMDKRQDEGAIFGIEKGLIWETNEYVILIRKSKRSSPVLMINFIDDELAWGEYFDSVSDNDVLSILEFHRTFTEQFGTLGDVGPQW